MVPGQKSFVWQARTWCICLGIINGYTTCLQQNWIKQDFRCRMQDAKTSCLGLRCLNKWMNVLCLSARPTTSLKHGRQNDICTTIMLISRKSVKRWLMDINAWSNLNEVERVCTHIHLILLPRIGKGSPEDLYALNYLLATNAMPIENKFNIQASST